MSRPKTGSTTAVAPADREGHAVLPEQDRLPAAGQRAGRPERGEHGDDHQAGDGERREVRHLVGLEGDRRARGRRPRRRAARWVRGAGSRTDRSARAGPRWWRGPLRRGGPRSRACAARPPRRAAGRGGRPARGWRRGRRARREGRREEADLRPEAGPEDRVEADALEPDRVGGEVQADADEEDGGEEDQADDDEQHLRAERSEAPAAGAAVVRAAGRATRRPSAPARAPAAAGPPAIAGPDHRWARRRARRLRRRRPVSASASCRRRRCGGASVGRRPRSIRPPASASSSGSCPPFGSDPAGGPSTRSALRTGLALVQLAEEVVEQVLHRG